MHVALIDPASFVLPYDCFFAQGLAAAGHRVSLFCSHTAYNEELLDELATLLPAAVQVHRHGISRTRSRSRWHGLAAYARLIGQVLRQRQRFDRVILQFGIFLPMDLVLMLGLRLALGRRLVLTIHDDVPHGFQGERHGPTLLRAWLAPVLVFPSAAVRDRFQRRYPWPSLAAKAQVLQHGTIAARLGGGLPPGDEPPRDGQALPVPVATFFGTVKPYKGIERLVELSESQPGDPVEIHGRWDAELAPLKQRALACGMPVNDAYLSTDALDALLRERRIFVLPYHAASQSGVLYLLLHHARPFICTASGDLGDFLQREGLQALVLPGPGPQDLAGRIAFVRQHYDALQHRLQVVRERYTWQRIVDASPLFRVS